MKLSQCPCCDHFTLDEPYEWDVCPVCYWEDDGTDLDRLDTPSSCNHGLTLRQARENFRRLGACEPGMIRHVCSVEDRRRYQHLPRP